MDTTSARDAEAVTLRCNDMDEYVKKKNIINELMEEKKDKSLFYDSNCSLKEALAYDDGLCNLAKMVFDMDAEEVVPKAAYDQVRWERDVCLEQLHSIGKELGEKMDDVREVRRGIWETVMMSEATGWDLTLTGGRDAICEYRCSVCKKPAKVDEFGEVILSNFCPECGADLRGVEDDQT